LEVFKLINMDSLYIVHLLVLGYNIKSNNFVWRGCSSCGFFRLCRLLCNRIKWHFQFTLLWV